MAKKTESTIAEKLEALYNLQKIDSEIDRIRTVRGELPLEVQDLEDEIEGLGIRLDKLKTESKEIEEQISEKQQTIKDAKALIKKYEGQQNKVRNNREFDSLTKEVEFQNLEIQLSEKRIKEAKAQIEAKKEVLEECKETYDNRKADLDAKKAELDDIVKETEKDEKSLLRKSKAAEQVIDNRLFTAYTRVRESSKNGLAVVPIERDSCGGCFNKIPPQRQLDIKTHKKVIVCEHCGRILVQPEEVPEKAEA